MSPRKSTKTTSKRASSTTKKVAPKPVKVAPRKASASSTKPTTRTKPGRGAPASTVSHDQIAKRAYEIWLNKGCPPDSDQANWLQAEKELAGAQR